jgi:hypothetical protein
VAAKRAISAMPGWKVLAVFAWPVVIVACLIAIARSGTDLKQYDLKGIVGLLWPILVGLAVLGSFREEVSQFLTAATGTLEQGGSIITKFIEIKPAVPIKAMNAPLPTARGDDLDGKDLVEEHEADRNMYEHRRTIRYALRFVRLVHTDSAGRLP